MRWTSWCYRGFLVVLIVIGLMGTINMQRARTERFGPEWLRGGFVLIAPALLATGVAGMVVELRRGHGAAPMRTTPEARPGKGLIWVGLGMLAVGVLPMAAAGILDDEGLGMLATIAFLLLGLPGLAVLGVGVAARRRRAADATP